MKKALIISPYLDHLGGGERYMLTCASTLESLGYEVSIGWDNLESITRICRMLAIELKSPQLVPGIRELYLSHNPLAMYRATRPYDVVVYLSDGSIPLLGGKVNLLHMQVPFHNIGGSSWKNKLKLKSIKSVVVNSNFTKRIVDTEYGISSYVLYPPVSSKKTVLTKEKIILSVGRFEPSLNVKKQDVLINAFKKLSSTLSDWKLVLVGGSTEDSWIKELNNQAAGYNIQILPNTTSATLQGLYAKASIYWHAAGYGVDEARSPELVEHFGISTVEAIAARALPLVYRAGGQTEIVRHDDLLWATIDELINKTINLTNKSFDNYESVLKIDNFSEEAFKNTLKTLL